MIDGQEYLLCGRYTDKEQAARAKAALLHSWLKVRIIKLSNWDYLLYVHGSKAIDI